MGFTMIEIMVVVVIIGILASIAWPRYVLVVEKSRAAEAKTVLGRIRTAETGYYLEYNSYTAKTTLLSLDIPASCNASFYYRYSIVVKNGPASFTATATRCTADGKTPNSPGGIAYVVNITENGYLGGTQPYV